MTTTTTTTTTSAPSPRTLRIAATGGLLLHLVCLVLTGMITLADAVDGDGVGGMFIVAGFWALAIGHLVGLLALFVPRRGLVIAEYCLAIAGPFLALMD